ncbi:hypothetical protein FRB95_008480 [Tulasnella sp. JGI-2019a]|nr:hypothetical protein FRB95_008480 [Tulasnella sp. JGI-2019a]
MEFRARYADKITYLEFDHPDIPKYFLSLPMWIRDLGPICPHITILHVQEGGETGLEGASTWLEAAALILPTVPSIEVSDWMQPDDALNWLTSTQACTVQTAHSKIYANEHPTYGKFIHLRMLTLEGEIGFHHWKELALSCQELRDLQLIVGDNGADGTEGQPTIFPALLRFPLAFRFGHALINRNALQMCLLGSEMPSLRSFMFRNSGLPTMELHVVMSYLPSLSVLSVRSSLEWLDLVDVKLKAFNFHQHRLKELCIEQSPNGCSCTHGAICTLNVFLGLVGNLYSQGLESLTISVGVTCDHDFDAAFATLPSLQSLRFQHLELDTRMEATFATFLAKICPNLRSLSIRCLYLRDSYRVVSSALLEEIFWKDRIRSSPPS